MPRAVEYADRRRKKRPAPDKAAILILKLEHAPARGSAGVSVPKVKV
jgi:hypothetical protein